MMVIPETHRIYFIMYAPSRIMESQYNIKVFGSKKNKEPTQDG